MSVCLSVRTLIDSRFATIDTGNNWNKHRLTMYTCLPCLIWLKININLSKIQIQSCNVLLKK